MKFLRDLCYKAEISIPKLLRPNRGSMEETMDSVRHCPWKEDIAIEVCSHIGSGAYNSVKGKHYHYVSCAADGPNNDAGKTFHHSYIGYWDYFFSFESVNVFAVNLQKLIKKEIGIEAPLYPSGKIRNMHSGWVLGERKIKPQGVKPEDLPITFKGVE